MLTEFDIRLDTSGDEDWPFARWGGPLWRASRRLWCDAASRRTSLCNPWGVERTWADPLDALDWLARSAVEGPAESCWIGWIGYDASRLFESLPARAADDTRLPLFEFTFHERDGDRFPMEAERVPRRDDRPRWNFSRDAYHHAVRRALDYIAAGDVFQVNLSQRCALGLREPAGVLYERLRRSAPATYGALLDYGDHALVCNSPELFLRVTPFDVGRHVITRPIKGTRPRAPGMAEQLRDSVKDQAELNMIIDLERNDLGRVCEVGTVKVVQPRAIEAHPTVYHGVATIEGMLRPEVTFVDLLRATFPGGSVTGAPKIRAMEIIDELEPVRRGPYCGAIGYLDSDGTIEFNIAIRTMIVTPDGLIHVPVGGGIVADSDPSAEYEETLVKATAMLQALGVEPPAA